MKVLITGSNGFIAQNLIVHLKERADIEITNFTRENTLEDLYSFVSNTDFIFHLAGVNRPKNIDEFKTGNTDLTQKLCAAIVAGNRKIPVIYTSSIQAELDNPYGNSKRAAEDAVLDLKENGFPVYIFRLPNVFGKWARPNYNSAVATFCHNIVNNLPIQINNPDSLINLVYVDDVVAHFIKAMDGQLPMEKMNQVAPQYSISVGELANQLYAFRDSRESLVSERVGAGLVRALYSTYVSYFPTEKFSYTVKKYEDPRGVFVEMLKTPDAGQFSFFTAHPGITRGGHYHHTKTEKFLVIKGKASFKFQHIVSGEFYELLTDGDEPEIVETVPGWTHDITNVGESEMIVMLWANEIFDRAYPDTYVCPISIEKYSQ